MQQQEFELAPPRIRLVAAAENYGRFAIEPLERGHALPLGNALRRVLLSSIPGAAVTRIKISGTTHEFATIPGLAEDGTELVLNIKGIRLRCFSERPVIMELVKRGPGAVFARDISAPSTIEIVNPEHYLCTIDDENIPLEMQLTAERGRRMALADSTDASIGEIAVDALYSPVPKVNILIEQAGAGIVEHDERLMLEIWTDGTVKPGDALSHAGQILAQHFGRIAVFNEVSPEHELPVEASSGVAVELFERPLDDLGLTTRTYNSLRRAGLTSVGQILSLDERALNSIRNLGPKGVEEIRARLETLGYVVGSGVSEAEGPPSNEDEPALEDFTSQMSV